MLSTMYVNLCILPHGLIIVLLKEFYAMLRVLCIKGFILLLQICILLPTVMLTRLVAKLIVDLPLVFVCF